MLIIFKCITNLSFWYKAWLRDLSLSGFIKVSLHPQRMSVETLYEIEDCDLTVLPCALVQLDSKRVHHRPNKSPVFSLTG